MPERQTPSTPKSTVSALESRPVTASSTAVPVLVAPVKDSTIDLAGLLFQWQEVPGAKAYWLEVAGDPEFKVLLFDTYIGRGTSLSLRNRLPGRIGTYYWRMKVQDESGWSSYGPVSTFHAGTATRTEESTRSARMVVPKGVPEPLDPTDNEPADAGILTLNWKGDPTHLEYHVQVACDADFHLIEFDAPVGSSTDVTLYDMVKEDNRIHHWRVRARTTGGWGDWSPTASFRASSHATVDTHKTAREKHKQNTRREQRRQGVKTGDTPVASGETSQWTMTLILTIMLIGFFVTLAVSFFMAVSF